MKHQATGNIGRATRRRRGRGQALVEFALVIPIFLLMLAGMIDFGMGLFSYQTVINAAREAARYGATACTTVACAAAGNPIVQQQAVSTASSGGLTVATIDVSVTCSSLPAGAAACDVVSTKPRSGGYVTVIVHYTYHMIWPLAFGTAISEDSTVQMRIE